MSGCARDLQRNYGRVWTDHPRRNGVVCFDRLLSLVRHAAAGKCARQMVRRGRRARPFGQPRIACRISHRRVAAPGLVAVSLRRMKFPSPMGRWVKTSGVKKICEIRTGRVGGLKSGRVGRRAAVVIDVFAIAGVAEARSSVCFPRRIAFQGHFAMRSRKIEHVRGKREAGEPFA